MTDPIQPRPQPVVGLANYAANIVGGVGGLAGAAGILATATHWSWAIAVSAALASAAAFLAKYVPKLAAIGAAAQVTPLSDPRDHQMNPLTYGKHAATTGGGYGWYDQGGTLPPGPSLAVNDTGAPEPVAASDSHDDDHAPSMGPDLPDDPPTAPQEALAVRWENELEDWMHSLRHDQQEPPRMTYRLGRKSNDPSRRRIRLTADIAPAGFTPPPAVDWYSKVPAASWGMDGNDAVGDCTCAEVDHSTKARQVAAGNAEVCSTADEVLKLYSEVTGYNPADPNTDRGAEMQAVRDYWRKNGAVLGGKVDKILLFAEVDHSNTDLVKWCVDQFGAVGLGINFPDSAMTQFDNGQPWDVVKGAKIEGGHAISLIGYDASYAYVVTWGRVQPMTWAFYREYVEEAWTDVSTDFVNAATGNDALGRTAYQLGQQFQEVTGQPNPFPAPSPAPAPAPGPAPAPAPSLPPASVAALMARILHRKGSPKEDVQAANEYDAWLAGQ